MGQENIEANGPKARSRAAAGYATEFDAQTLDSAICWAGENKVRVEKAWACKADELVFRAYRGRCPIGLAWHDSASLALVNAYRWSQSHNHMDGHQKCRISDAGTQKPTGGEA